MHDISQSESALNSTYQIRSVILSYLSVPDASICWEFNLFPVWSFKQLQKIDFFYVSPIAWKEECLCTIWLLMVSGKIFLHTRLNTDKIHLGTSRWTILSNVIKTLIIHPGYKNRSYTWNCYQVLWLQMPSFRVFEFEWGFYTLSASKAIFRARTYNCITYSVRWWWLLDEWN